MTLALLDPLRSNPTSILGAHAQASEAGEGSAGGSGKQIEGAEGGVDGEPPEEWLQDAELEGMLMNGVAMIFTKKDAYADVRFLCLDVIHLALQVSAS